MPTIEFTFPGRRYHATTWGTHVNEGQIEWPPSPWRLLRMLLSAGYTRLHWTTPPDTAVKLIERLSGVLPSYLLPPAIEAHTRHYMPVVEGKTETKTKVLDTFLRFVRDSHREPSLLVHYAVDLEGELQQMLTRLTGSLTYLGRAESWADARLIDECLPDETWVRPAGENEARDGNQVILTAAVRSDQYAKWRETALHQQLQRETRRRGSKLMTTQQRKLQAAFPVDLMECLQWETADVKQHRWNQPPGTRRVLYHQPPRRAPLLQRRTATAGQQEPVEAALIRLAIDHQRAARLPPMTRCLPQAEALHLALVSILNKLQVESPAVTGRTRDRMPLAGDHSHAHFVPLDMDADGSIDHFLIHAPMKLDDGAQRAIRRLRRTWAKGIPSILLRWVGFGSLAELRDQLTTRHGSTPSVFAESTVVETRTPYVPPRWLKSKNNRYTVEDDICRELRSRGKPQPVRIEVWNRDYNEGRKKLAKGKLLLFTRARHPKKPQPPQRLAFGATLYFDKPVQCPLSIGYASHFGLGLFGATQ